MIKVSAGILKSLGGQNNARGHWVGQCCSIQNKFLIVNLLLIIKEFVQPKMSLNREGVRERRAGG